jgi:hypothetical protein
LDEQFKKGSGCWVDRCLSEKERLVSRGNASKVELAKPNKSSSSDHNKKEAEEAEKALPGDRLIGESEKELKSHPVRGNEIRSLASYIS